MKGQNHARANDLAAHGCISRRTACLSKVAYVSLNDARHAAKRVANKTGRDTGTYVCPFCKHWHVTKAKHGQNNDAEDQ